jgi:hypothetical protein
VVLKASCRETLAPGTLALAFDFATAAATSQAKPELKVINTGSSPLALSGLKVRYWLTNETAASLQATVWWANRAQSALVATVGVN